MAVVIQQQDPFTAALGSVAGYLTQKKQNAADAQQAELTRQQIAVAAANAAMLQRQSGQETSNRQFESGLQYPTGKTVTKKQGGKSVTSTVGGWSKMAPDEKLSYLQVRYNNALKAGDDNAAKQTLDEMNSIELGASRLAGAAYTMQGKLPLAQAQTWSIRSEKPKEFQMKLAADTAALKARLGNQWQLAVMREQGAMARNAASIGARGWIAKMNNDNRNDLAVMTAVNRLQGMDEQNAFRTALSQYQSQMVVYKAGLTQAASQGSDALQTYQQQNPMPTINISAPQSAPNIIFIPNPRGGNPLPVVVNHPKTSATARIGSAVQKGYQPDDPRVIQAMQSEGYSAAEISGAVAGYRAHHRPPKPKVNFNPYGVPQPKSPFNIFGHP